MRKSLYILILFSFASLKLFANLDSLTAKSEKDEFEAEEALSSTSSSNENISGLVFKIKVAYLSKEAEPSFIEYLKPITVEKSIDLKSFRYYVGFFRTIEAANKAKRELRSWGYYDCEVVAFLDGIKIPIYKAEKLIASEILMSKKEYKKLSDYEVDFLDNKQSLDLSYTDIDYDVKGKYSQAQMSYSIDFTKNKKTDFLKDFIANWLKRPMSKKSIYWKFGADVNLQFNQQELSHWVDGGDNFLNFITDNKVTANYQKKIFRWENTVQERISYQRLEGEDFRKNDEKFQIDSKFSIQAISNWNYSGLLQLKSQLFPTFDKKTGIKVNEFLSPGYLNFSFGMDFRHKDAFSFFISPISFNSTFVAFDDEIDYTKFGISEGNSALFEFGSHLIMSVNLELYKNIIFETKLDLFSDYEKNLENVDLDWEGKLKFKFNKYFDFRLSCYAIYKEKVNINVIKDKGAVASGFRQGIQFKELLTISLNYSF